MSEIKVTPESRERAEAFKRSRKYLLHPANSPRNEERTDPLDEFKQRQRYRVRAAIVDDFVEQLGEIHDNIRRGSGADD